MTNRTQQILKRLAALGVAGTFAGDSDEQTDGEIRITPTVSVQVGVDYLIVNVSDSATDPTAFRHYPARTDRELQYLVEDIKMAEIFDFNAEPVFRFIDKTWQIEVYHGPNGGSIIERWRGPKGLKPRMWVSEHSPETFVNMQSNPAKYIKAEVPA
jgi:hypothetical protein